MSLLHQLVPHEPEKPVKPKKLTVNTPKLTSKPAAANTCPTCGQRLKQTPAERKAYMALYMRKKRAKEKK